MWKALRTLQLYLQGDAERNSDKLHMREESLDNCAEMMTTRRQ